MLATLAFVVALPLAPRAHSWNAPPPSYKHDLCRNTGVVTRSVSTPDELYAATSDKSVQCVKLAAGTYALSKFFIPAGTEDATAIWLNHSISLVAESGRAILDASSDIPCSADYDPGRGRPLFVDRADIYLHGIDLTGGCTNSGAGLWARSCIYGHDCIPTSLTMHNVSIYKNRVRPQGIEGGGAYLDVNVTVEMHGVKVYYNTGGYHGGNGMLIQGGPTVIVDSEVYENENTMDSGGEYYDGDAGGILLVGDFDVSMYNTAVHNNPPESGLLPRGVRGSGGGICVNPPTFAPYSTCTRKSGCNLAMYGCQIHNNWAGGPGGGLQFFDTYGSWSKLTLVDTDIYNNTAAGGGGINIEKIGGPTGEGGVDAMMQGCHVRNNMAEQYGGAGILSNGNLTLIDTFVTGNTVKQVMLGGAAGVTNQGNLTIINSVIAHNSNANATASFANDLFSFPSANLSITESTKYAQALTIGRPWGAPSH